MKNRGHLSIAAILVLAFSMPAFCQNTHIYYNLFNDSITYVKGGKKVDKLRLRKGQDVQIHLTEFNPFTSNVDLKVEETIDNTGSGLDAMAGMNAIMPGMGGGLGDLTMGGEGFEGGGLPFLDAPLFVISDSVISIKNLLSGSRGGDQIDLANQTMKEIDNLIKEAATIHSQLQAYERAVQVSKLALVNVEPMLKNPNIKPSLIKNMCQEYYDGIFLKQANNSISLNDLLAWQNLPSNYDLNISRLKSKQAELGMKVGMLEGISKDISGNPIDNETYRQYVRNMVDTQIKARGVRDQLKEITTRAKLPEDLPNTQEIAALQMKLAEVMSNDFTYNTTIQPSADQVSLGIKLMATQVNADSTEPILIKERSLKMEVRGGLKVSASAGLSFSQFFDPSQSFTVSNGQIIAENEGVFTPSLTSFLHFHGYRGQKATVGGSLGLGFPLLSSGDSQSIEFFMGPSLMLGHSQRLVISAGLMGGRAQRLAKGYKVGDAFDTDFGDIPTQGKYEMGLFLGASFSLSK